MNRSVAEFALERKPFLSQAGRQGLRRQRQRTPRGGNFSGRWVATHDQQLELVGRQFPGCLGRTDRPETEPARRQPTMAEPKPGSVIGKDFNGRTSPVAKDVQRAGKRIALELLFTKASQ